MPFVPVPNSALVEVRMLQDLQEVENTLWFERNSPWDVAGLTSLNNFIVGWWASEMSPIVSELVVVREVVCTDMTTASGPQVSLPPPDLLAGALDAPTLPNNVTLTVSFRTAARGRSFRGRNYFVGLTQDSVVENTVNAGFVTQIQDAYAELLNVGDTVTSARWIVASRFSGVDGDGNPIPRVSGVTTDIVSVTIVDPVIDSQRRRLPGRGR